MGEIFFKPSGDEPKDFIKDFNKVVNKIGSKYNYMEKNYKTMDDLLKQPEVIYILSYLSQDYNFADLTNTGESNNKIWNVDDFIEYLNEKKELDDETKDNIAKWKSFLNTVPDDFKKLANDLNDVYQGKKNANEVNCFGDDDVKKLLDQVTPKEKSKTLDASEKTSDNLDNNIEYEQEFEMSGDLVSDFNRMVHSLNERRSEFRLGLNNNYNLFRVVSYLSQCNHFDKITDVNKIEDFIKFENNNNEPDENTTENIATWKEFLNKVNKEKSGFLEGCKEFNRITHEETKVDTKEIRVSRIKTFFSWLFSGTKDSFTNYLSEKDKEAKEEYINSKSESNKSAYKSKKESLVQPLSKILFNAKLQAKKEVEKNTENGMQV